MRDRYEDVRVSHVVMGLLRLSATEMQDIMQRFTNETRPKV